MMCVKESCLSAVFLVSFCVSVKQTMCSPFLLLNSCDSQHFPSVLCLSRTSVVETVFSSGIDFTEYYQNEMMQYLPQRVHERGHHSFCGVPSSYSIFLLLRQTHLSLISSKQVHHCCDKILDRCKLRKEVFILSPCSRI